MVNAIGQLGRAQMQFLGDAYGNLGQGTARTKIIPIFARIDTLAGASPNKVACRSGCDSCCHYHIYVTPLEVFSIVEEVKAWPPARQNALLAALHRYVEKVKPMGKLRHVTMNIACSFLKDEACTIYAMRPLACRRHHSADRSVCERTFQDPQSMEHAPKDKHRVIVSAALETLHAEYHRYRGFDRDSYEFQSALLEALTDPTSRKRWNAGKAAFQTVTDREPSRI